MELSTLLITGSVLLLLTGLTVTGTVLGLIFFAPLIIVSSPIWVPVGTVLFMVVAGFLSMCGFGVVVVAVLYWMYRYFRGMDPPGSDWIDYARNRIYDTASHVKEACFGDDRALPAAAEREPRPYPRWASPPDAT